MAKNPAIPDRHIWQRLRPILAVSLAISTALFVWTFRVEIVHILADPVSLRTFAADAGWMGPLVLVVVNILQIVVAPIPGYGIYFLAGFLFGPLWGGVWGSIGLMSGAMTAMWLARRFGRPLVMRIIGDERFRRWEKVTHSESGTVWMLILLSPMGDTPYLLAGLSRVGFGKILVLTAGTRIPVAFAAAAAGAGVLFLNWWQLLILTSLLAGPLLLFLRYQPAVLAWIHRKANQRIE